MPRDGAFLTHLIAALAFLQLARAQTAYQSFTAFTGVLTTLDFYGNLVPSPDNKAYDVSLSGPAEVRAAFQPILYGGVLSLGLKSAVSLELAGSVNYTVRMPRTTLRSLSLSGNGDFDVNGGVISKLPFAVSVAGSGVTSIVDVPATAISTKSVGNGTLIVYGSGLPAVSLTSYGSGETYFGVVTGQTTVLLAGNGSAYINTDDSGASQITGTSLAQGKVYYDSGRCFVSGQAASNACLQGQVKAPF